MRLDTEFIRLPLSIDAARLAAEIEALGEAAWRPHPQGHPGNSALALVAVNGDANNDAVRGAMQPTPHLARCPYLRQVLAALRAPIGRTRLMRLDGNAEATSHVDINYYWQRRLRVHVPVVTDPAVSFHVGERTLHMAAGEVWVFDTWKLHNVVNPNPTRRIHLVIDTVGSPDLSMLLSNGERPFRPNAVGTPDHAVGFDPQVEPRVEYEARNFPVVMSPEEMSGLHADWLADLANAANASPLREVVQEHVAAWRALWREHRDARSGWRAYADLIERTRHRLGALPDARVANGSSATMVAEHVLLSAALNTDLAPVLGARHRLERPVFIVSAPRSGSSLLFETLSQAAGLYTIGGESHAVMEGIEALHPRARGYASNVLEASDATAAVVDDLAARWSADAVDRDGRRPPPGRFRLLEKTPKNSLRVAFLKAAFPDARFIFLFRDERATQGSMLDAWRSGRFVTYPELPGWSGPPWSLALTPGWQTVQAPLEAIVAQQWAALVDRLLDDLQALPADDWAIVSYDQLVRDPQGEAARLCAFIGVPWDRELPATLPDSRHTLTPPTADKWQVHASALAPHEAVWTRAAQRARDLFARAPLTRIGPASEPPQRAVPAQAPMHPQPVASPQLPAAEQSPLSAPTHASPHRPTPTPRNAPTHGPARAQSGAPVPGPHAATPPATTAAPDDFRSQHTRSFPALLSELGASLLVSTYQSGRVMAMRADGGALNTHLRFFPSPMGMAFDGARLALGTLRGVWHYRNMPAVAKRLHPPIHDACFVPRRFHTTGDIRVHDLGYAADGTLWIVNTRFSALCTLDDDHSFVPRWRPRFVSGLAAEDRCHLNGLALRDGRPRYVTALGTGNAAESWRAGKNDGGVVIDIDTDALVARGLAMPHSPRWHDGKLWVLESARGELGYVDFDTQRVITVAQLPGFTRGLAFAGPLAFVGLSQVRESVFEGIPLAERLAAHERACGVWVVDTRDGRTVAFVRFEGVVQEIFDVLMLPGMRYPELLEPEADLVSGSFELSDAALRDVEG